MTDRCKEKVMPTGRMFTSLRACTRNAVKDGFCAQHHPDAKQARREAQEALWAKKQAASPFAQLEKARKRIKELEDANASLRNSVELLSERGQ